MVLNYASEPESSRNKGWNLADFSITDCWIEGGNQLGLVEVYSTRWGEGKEEDLESQQNAGDD
jgi:hypothetical protein